MAKRIGVLAAQGAFAAHRAALESLGAEVVEVRTALQLASVPALVIPGGESTTMLKFLDREELRQPLADFLAAGKPCFGTCAGAILLAKQVSNPGQWSFGALDIDVARNAYGRQRDSTILMLDAPAVGPDPLEAVFIRAPAIVRVGSGVAVWAERNGQPVLVRQGPLLAATFHPELTSDRRLHQRFLELVP